MPVYEYECPACEKIFEVQQKISDEPLRECPDCGGAVKKLISQSSFHLKGGGWYKDGYSSSGGKTSEKKKSTAKNGDSAKTSCKSETPACKNCPAAAS